MDNASFHYTERVRNLCSAAKVKLMYLPPYSPDLNPIKQFFAELKGFIKRHYQDHSSEDFGDFLKWCVMLLVREKKVQKIIFNTLVLLLKSMKMGQLLIQYSFRNV
jgi:transposase